MKVSIRFAVIYFTHGASIWVVGLGLARSLMSCHHTVERTSLLPEEAPRGADPVDARLSREQLILAHLPQVHLLARRFKARLPVWVNEEDLYAAGIVDLIAAVDRYRPEYQTSLRTFAEHKIRSAMLDSLRAWDWASRRDRHHGRLLERAQTALETKQQRPPTEQEMAAELGISLPQYHAWRSDQAGLTLASLDAALTAYGNAAEQSLADAQQHWPSAVYERQKQEEALRQALARLPEHERTVLHLYYYEERTLVDIAQRLQVNASRVSQIKKRAVQRLRLALGRRDAET